VNLSSTHFVSSIIYNQPPVAAVWTTEFPLVASMHSSAALGMVTQAQAL